MTNNGKINSINILTKQHQDGKHENKRKVNSTERQGAKTKSKDKGIKTKRMQGKNKAKFGFLINFYLCLEYIPVDFTIT